MPAEEECSDDGSILGADFLLRRLFPGRVVQGSDGLPRITNQAFRDSADGTPLSASLAKGWADYRALLSSFPGYGLARFAAAAARAQGQAICRRPEPDDPHHTLVRGPKPKSVKNALVAASELVVTPTPERSSEP